MLRNDIGILYQFVTSYHRPVFRVIIYFLNVDVNLSGCRLLLSPTAVVVVEESAQGHFKREYSHEKVATNQVACTFDAVDRQKMSTRSAIHEGILHRMWSVM